jgi:hypothetical protein
MNQKEQWMKKMYSALKMLYKTCAEKPASLTCATCVYNPQCQLLEAWGVETPDKQYKHMLFLEEKYHYDEL